MKRILMATMSLFSYCAMADEWTDPDTGITWTYTITDGAASVGMGWQQRAVPTSTAGAIAIPATLGNCPVTSIDDNAFKGCSSLTSVAIPEGVTNIGDGAFEGCSGLTSITIPSSVKDINANAFNFCSKLSEIIFEGDGPATSTIDIFEDTPHDMIVRINRNSNGWFQWKGRRVSYKDNGNTSDTVLVVTNVVIHYVVNSVQPEKVIPASMDTGFVNIITEVKSGGAVSVPATWMVNYPNYVTKFGSDFTKSLMKTTGKKDGANQPMRVWQDYVAGTDPTDTNDVFTASITTDATGKFIISYNPGLSDEEKAKRIYKTLGKVKLTDADWVEVPAGHEADYNFFKVTVEMK